MLSGTSAYFPRSNADYKILTMVMKLPAVYESLQHGITVVISPLKALISDQCSSLARTDIYVVRYGNALSVTLSSSSAFDPHFVTCSFSGDQSSEERMTMFRKLFLATSCMLYVTPEMFFGIACQNAISELYAQNRLARFVVDEAHCILEVCGRISFGSYKYLLKFAPFSMAKVSGRT